MFARSLPALVCASMLLAPCASGSAIVSTQHNGSAGHADIAIELVPPEDIDRSIEACGEHVYRLRLRAGSFVRGFAEQDRVNVLVEVRRVADDVVISSADGQRDEGGRERFLVLAEGDEQYEIRVRRIDERGTPGSYRLHVEKPAEITAAVRLESVSKGLLLIAAGEPADRQMPLLEQARSFCRGASAIDCEALALHALARAHWLAGSNLPRGRDLLIEAIQLRETSHDTWEQGLLFNDLAVFHRTLGDPLEARAAYERSAELLRTPSGWTGVLPLHNAALLHWQLGDLQKALDTERLVLDRWKKGESGSATGYAYTVLGQFAFHLGDLPEARRMQTLAMNVFAASDHETGLAVTTSRMGTILEAEGKAEEALALYRQSAAMFSKVPDRLGEAGTLASLSGLLLTLGRLDEAEEAIQRVREIIQEAKSDESTLHQGLADIAVARKQWLDALDHYRQAQELTERSGDSAALATAMLGTARVQRNRGNLACAREVLDRATETIEILRLRITSPEGRGSYLAARQAYYDLTIDVLMQLHQKTGDTGPLHSAFEMSERARSRALLDSLAMAGLRQKGMDPELAKREELYRHRINGKAAALVRVNAGTGNRELATLLRTELEQFLLEYRSIRAEIDRLPELEGATVLDTIAVQKHLDDDTLLLEFALAEPRSYVWVVDRNTISAFQLPGRAEIERLARRTVELLSTSNRTDRRGASRVASRQLSKEILAPIAHLLRNKRLAIVADGALQFVPFAAIADPNVPGQPLIVNHEIVSLPSASALVPLRIEPRFSQPIGELAVIADPVVAPDDVRLGGRAKGATGPNDLLRAAASFGDTTFARLPHTRVEADRISDLVTNDTPWKAFGFDATRAAILDGALARYRRIHFATHGLINSEHPELSGLVLSLYEPDGSSSDGFLRLTDIHSLSLDADLVVMSACRTALGREVRREGLIGLTRGFMAAGARRVVGSLWEVRDGASAELMHRFYSRMLRDRMPAAAALRSAQVSMLNEPRWNAPFYWGAFVLHGDWE